MYEPGVEALGSDWEPGHLTPFSFSISGGGEGRCCSLEIQAFPRLDMSPSGEHLHFYRDLEEPTSDSGIPGVGGDHTWGAVCASLTPWWAG